MDKKRGKNDFKKAAKDLLEFVISVKNDSGKLACAFQITANPEFKQFLTLDEFKNEDMKEKNKETLSADALVERIVARASKQKPYLQNVQSSQRVIEEFLEEIRHTVEQWISEVKVVMRQRAGVRVTCYHFMKRFSGGEFSNMEDLVESLKEVIRSLDIDKDEMFDKSWYESHINDMMTDLKELDKNIKGLFKKFKTDQTAPKTKEKPFSPISSLSMNDKNLKEVMLPTEKSIGTRSMFAPPDDNGVIIPPNQYDEGLSFFNQNQVNMSVIFQPHFVDFHEAKELLSLKMPAGICYKGRGLVHFLEDYYAVLSVDGSILVFKSKEMKNQEFTVKKKTQLSIGSSNIDCCISASPDGKKLLISGYSNKKLYLLNCTTLDMIYQWQAPDDTPIWESTFIDNWRVVSGHGSGFFRIFEQGKSAPIYQAAPCPKGVRSLCPGLKQHLIYIGYSYCNGVYLWDIMRNCSLWNATSHKSAITTMTLCVTLKILATGSYDRTVALMNAETGEQLHLFRDFSETIMKIDMSEKKENILVTSCNEQVLYARKPDNKNLWTKLAVREKSKGETSSIQAVAMNWEAGFCLVGNFNSEVFLVDLVPEDMT